MRFSRSLLIGSISLFLFLIYLLLEGNIISSILIWKAVSHDDFPYKWEMMREGYRYAATNIFDKSYKREDSLDFQKRVSTYPAGSALRDGIFHLSGDSPEGIVAVSLPKGFIDGQFWLKVTTGMKFKIAISADLKDWQYEEYQGFPKQITYYVVPIGRENQANNKIFLKFIPSYGTPLDVYFDYIEYRAEVVPDNKEYYNVLFYPETDIDFNGEEID